MPVLLLILVAVVVFLAVGAVRHALRRLDREGSHLLLWRWLSAGGNWSGKAVTNRGLTRPGSRALTATGYAHRRWHWTRLQHAAWRIQWTLAVLLTGTGLLVCFRRTEQYLAVSALASGGYGIWRGGVWAREHHHRGHHYKPLHVRLHHRRRDPAGDAPRVVAGNPPRPVVCAGRRGRRTPQLPKAEDRQAD